MMSRLTAKMLRILTKTSRRWKILLIAIAAVCGFCILPDGITSHPFLRFQPVGDYEKDNGIIKENARHQNLKIISRINSQLESNKFNEEEKKEKKTEIITDKTHKSSSPSNQNNAASSSGSRIFWRGVKPPEVHKDKVLLSSKKYGEIWVENIVGETPGTLQKKMTSKADVNAPRKLILSWNAGHGPENLGGCPDWNCEFSVDHNRLSDASAVLTMSTDIHIDRASNPNLYIVYFSQESPIHSYSGKATNDYYNMSLNYRRDSPISSPYGYSIKLAPESYRDQPFNESLIMGKKKTVAWFVSNCFTHSQREQYVNILQKYIEVDVYGGCQKLKCDRGGACEEMLDNDYHFYVAFENSVCKDYITEKLWNQGFQHTIVPIVLKGDHVRSLLPPKSFIAADDFNDVKDLADYLFYLINNKTAYMEYFAWKKDHAIIFLNGNDHDQWERPWGFCQLCRLLWEEPKEKHTIADFDVWWGQSCEATGAVVNKLIANNDNNASNLDEKNVILEPQKKVLSGMQLPQNN